MAWLFTQVWLWSLAAFALGALLNWLLFVRPLRRQLNELLAEQYADYVDDEPVRDESRADRTALDLLSSEPRPSDEPTLGDWERSRPWNPRQQEPPPPPARATGRVPEFEPAQRPRSGPNPLPESTDIRPGEPPRRTPDGGVRPPDPREHPQQRQPMPQQPPRPPQPPAPQDAPKPAEAAVSPELPAVAPEPPAAPKSLVPPKPEPAEPKVSKSSWFQKAEPPESEPDQAQPGESAAGPLRSLFEPLAPEDELPPVPKPLASDETQSIPRIQEPPEDAEVTPLPRRTPGAGPRPGAQNLQRGGDSGGTQDKLASLERALAERPTQEQQAGEPVDGPSESETTIANAAVPAEGSSAQPESAAQTGAESRTAEGKLPEEPESHPADSTQGEGYLIKGHFASRMYHTPESPQYPRVTAEVWFRTREDAEQAGFEPWDGSRN